MRRLGLVGVAAAVLAAADVVAGGMGPGPAGPGLTGPGQAAAAPAPSGPTVPGPQAAPLPTPLPLPAPLPPMPLARPDLILPSEGSLWLTAEGAAGGSADRSGGAVAVGVRPLPGLVLNLTQPTEAEATAAATLRLWPESAAWPGAGIGVTGLGGWGSGGTGGGGTADDPVEHEAAGAWLALTRGLPLGGLGDVQVTGGLAWRLEGAGRRGRPDPWGRIRLHPAGSALSLAVEGGRVGRHRRPRVQAAWHIIPGIDLSAGVEAGCCALLGLTLTLSPEDGPGILTGGAAPKPLRPPPSLRRGRDIWVPATAGEPPASSIGRAAAAGLPPEGALTLHTHGGGLPGAAVTVMAGDVAAAIAHRGSAAEIALNARFHPARPPPASTPPRLEPTITLVLDQGPGRARDGLGGSSDGTVWVHRLMVEAGALLTHATGLQAGGSLRLRLDGSTDELGGAAAGQATGGAGTLRADLDRYPHPDGGIGVATAWIGWQTRITQALALRLEAGHLEEMAGGAGGELHWQPFDSRLSLALSLHRVGRREPGRLDLTPGSGRGTGFAAIGYDLPGRDATATLSVGRFLGGDDGLALDLERRFDTGARLVAEATWSDGELGGDLGGADLGESRFALGLRLHLPLGALIGPLAGEMDLTTRPQGRETGQRLDRRHTLARAVHLAGFGRLSTGWPHLLDGAGQVHGPR